MTVIQNCAFGRCKGLAALEIPAAFSRLGEGVFEGVTKLDRLTLLGSPLSPAVVANLKACLFLGPVTAPRVIGPALPGQMFGRFSIRVA
jgi:hypothetical protein